jgi:hypothetical protein
LTLRALDPYGNGKLVLLEVTYERDYHSNFIYIIAVLLGIFGVSAEYFRTINKSNADLTGGLRRSMEYGKRLLDKARPSQDMDENPSDPGGCHGNAIYIDNMAETY